MSTPRLTDEQIAGLMSGDLDMEDLIAEAHAERYPDGCRVEGHRCEPCTKRLGERPHRIKSVKVGARKFYAGTYVHTCTECNWEER